MLFQDGSNKTQRGFFNAPSVASLWPICVLGIDLFFNENVFTKLVFN